jgi:hypothetical protein
LKQKRGTKRAEAQQAKEKQQERERAESETGKKTAGRKPPALEDPDQAKPEPKSQRNFTDGESRIMPDGSNRRAFIQGYNGQIVIDAHAQVIVASAVSQQTNDKRQMLPMIELAKGKLLGMTPQKLSADAGYFAADAVNDERLEGIDL